MFVSPFFLIAAAAGAVVPLILHLMQNRKRDKMPFPTLRFLKAAEKQSSRRIRMENLLLWLIRTLIMILIGLAFAMPILRSQGMGWLGDAPRDIAIVIDGSYSMGYNTGRQTVWKKATDTARSIVEGLGDNDRFCIYVAREQPEALIAEPIGDKEQGISRLKGLEEGTGSSQLAPAVNEAIKALKKEERQHEREVYLLTDNQALPWQSFGAAKAADGETEEPASGDSLVGLSWDPAVIDERTTMFAVLLGVPSPENVGPEVIDLQPSLVRKNSAAKVVARLFRSGRTPETTATLFVNDEAAGRLPVRLDSSEASDLNFALPPLPQGVHVARVETPDDNLPIDNAFHFVIRVEDRLPSLCVGTEDDTLFVRTALETGFGAPPDIVSPEQVTSKRLDDYACIFLCNALPVSGQALTALEQFARSGGLLVIFPGTRANLEAYQPWTCLPAVPTSIEETARAQRNRTLAWDEPAHPLILPLRRGVSVPVLTVRRHLAWTDLPEETGRLIAMGAEQPFLLERPFGDGRVLMFAVAADRTWSEFPLSPFYLPMSLQCVDYSSGFGARSPFLWSTDSLSLNDLLPEADRGATLRGPDRKAVPIRSTVVEGRTLLVAEDLQVPGIYNLSTPDQPVAKPALAINLPRRESDLTPIPSDDIAGRLGVEQVYLATDLETLMAQIEEHRVGRTYGELLLWLALVLIVIEFFYANALYRSGPKLSDQLGLDPAGQVKGHATAAG